MTPDELRELAQECFEIARECHISGDFDDVDELSEASDRLDNAASILDEVAA